MRQVTLDDIPSAPIIVEVVEQIAAPRQRVFDLLSGDPARWGDFISVLDHKGHWVKETPDGIGAVRSIGRGKARLTETILAKDDGKRWAFRVESGPLPGVKAFLEDYLLEDSPGGCTLRWTGVVWPVGPAALVRPVVTAPLKAVIRRLTRGVERAAA